MPGQAIFFVISRDAARKEATHVQTDTGSSGWQSHFRAGLKYQIVAAITGGGTGAITHMLERGGASSVFLNGHIPYGKGAIADYLGFEPEKYVSDDTARKMGLAANREAIKLGTHPKDAVGLGATASLVRGDNKGEIREDGSKRRHQLYVAVQTYNALSRFYYLISEGPGKRLAEEEASARNIMGSLLFSLNMGDLVSLDIEPAMRSKEQPLNDGFAKLNSGEWDSACLAFDGTVLIIHGDIIYPGSFNPMHDGHIEVLKKAHKLTGKRVILEICSNNVDKPPLDYIDIQARTFQIEQVIRNEHLEDIVKGIVFTNLPRFREKARILGGGYMLMGADTAGRVADRKFYDSYDEWITVPASLDSHGTGVIIASRPGYEKEFYNSKNFFFGMKKPPIYFECTNTNSSSKIREKHNNAGY